MKVIHELAKSKTILLISHRLSNVTESDCIYMLKSGMIVEKGTHAELMEMGGAYWKLFESQRQLEQFKKVVEA